PSRQYLAVFAQRDRERGNAHARRLESRDEYRRMRGSDVPVGDDDDVVLDDHSAGGGQQAAPDRYVVTAACRDRDAPDGRRVNAQVAASGTRPTPGLSWLHAWSFCTISSTTSTESRPSVETLNAATSSQAAS